MKLARLKDDPRFYSIVIGEELFDFDIIVPMKMRLTTPLNAGEYLPVLSEMLQKEGMLARHNDRLQRATLEDFLPFRRPLDPTRLNPPVRPPSFRDFYSFEQHVRTARSRRGLEMVAEWYEIPVFYFSNISEVLGPADPLVKPGETEELDFELEIAAVIGRAGKDIPLEEADSHIVGFTVLNDWSARDIQRQEMKVGLGPAKGKDFATSIGPYLVTPDELQPFLLPDQSRGRRYSLSMTAQVNGQEISRGNAADMRWTFAELIVQASRNVTLLPGDLIGSGTVGTGCLMEFPLGTYPWLQPGDQVRLEIEGVGILNTPIL